MGCRVWEPRWADPVFQPARRCPCGPTTDLGRLCSSHLQHSPSLSELVSRFQEAPDRGPSPAPSVWFTQVPWCCSHSPAAWGLLRFCWRRGELTALASGHPTCPCEAEVDPTLQLGPGCGPGDRVGYVAASHRKRTLGSPGSKPRIPVILESPGHTVLGQSESPSSPGSLSGPADGRTDGASWVRATARAQVGASPPSQKRLCQIDPVLFCMF